MANIVYYEDIQLVDGVKGFFGTGEDLEIYHDGTESSYIKVTAGDLYIRSEADDQQIYIQGDNGSGGVANYLTIDGNLGYTLAGKDIRFNDSIKARFGTGLDSYIQHTGTNTEIINATGNLNIKSTATDGDITFYADDGAGGTTTYFYLDGSLVNGTSVLGATRFPDKSKIYMGTGGDLEIFHDGSQSGIENYTGNLEITQHANDGDLVFKSDDGSGGVANYIVMAGAETLTSFQKNTRHNDNVKANFGTGSDLQIDFDGTNGQIQQTAGDLYITNSANDKDIIFQSDDGSGGTTEYFRLDGGTGHLNLTPPNNVGIGTTSPSYKLDITHAGSGLRLNSSADQQLRFERTSGNAFSIEHDTARIYLYNRTTSAAAVAVDNAGNFGIGTVSPSMKLNISHGDQDGLRFTAANTHETFIDFGDTDDNDAGSIRYDHNDNSLAFRVNASESARIDSSGRLVVGNNAAVATVGGTGHSQVLGTGNSDTVFTIGRFSNNTGVGQINFLKSRNGTIGSNTIVQDDDGMGAIVWAAADGSDFVSHAAKIDARIDGTPGANDTPGRLIFYTTADGSDSAVERVRIDSAGNMRFSDNASNPSASSNMAFIFNDGGEMKVLDELGNTTTISPHNFELIPEGASEDMAWSHHSVKGNKTVNVDMMKLARLVEELTGEKLVYTEET